MLAWAGWIVAGALGLWSLVVRSAWKQRIAEAEMLKEFLAIVFIDTGVYKNNQREFKRMLGSLLGREVDLSVYVAVTQGTSNIATSFIAQLGPTKALRAFLEDYQGALPKSDA